MNNKNYTLYIFFFTIMLFFSCSTVSTLKTDNSTNKKTIKSTTEAVTIYALKNIGKDYIILGEVIAAADAGSNADGVIEKLAVQAKKLGADSIVGLRLEIDTGYWTSAIKATGTAVKIKK